MRILGGKGRWEATNQSRICYTLFDTGADSANYIYSYYVEELRRTMDIETIYIEEPVRFGDLKTHQTLWEAVVLDVEFEDPTNTNNKQFRNKHVFKVLKLNEPVKNSMPIVLGVPTICSYYLELLVNLLRHGHERNRQGLSWSVTLQEEISKLRLRQNPVKVLHRNSLSKITNVVTTDTYVGNKEDAVTTELEEFANVSELSEEALEEVKLLHQATLQQNQLNPVTFKEKDDSTFYLEKEPVSGNDVLKEIERIGKSLRKIRNKKKRKALNKRIRTLHSKLEEDLNPKFDYSSYTLPSMNYNHISSYEDYAQLGFDIDAYMEKTIPPWTYNVGESPEELDSYIPCDNTGLFNYLSTTHEEALDKYFADCKKNTAPEAWSYVKDILHSQLAQDQFCPHEWTGMKDVEPIDLQFVPEFEQVKLKGLGPKGTKAFVNEKMKEHYYKEFRRMRDYMYVPSNSSTASRIIVADKATPPWVRICGDYRIINKYVKLPQVVIPNIRNEIYRARKYKYYINLDLANGFHNLPITKATAEALALATEWGLYEPKFMPEGVRSAPQEFQRIMRQVFEPMKEHAIVIWDNVLVLCNTLEEVAERLQQVLEICKKHNIILKMAKTQIGFTSADFFGYLVKQNTIELTQERKDGIQALRFFKNTKGAQSFLGSCNFFKDFIPNYSQHTCKLNDMTRKDFNWDRSTWKEPYEEEFENLKLQIQNAMTLHFPDYNKLWILRTDCSKDALGAILFQVGEDGIYEPIAFVSQKLSEQAKNWAAVKLEAYAVYYAVKKLAYYLLGHTFVIEVDHANLVSMEHSEQHIIQRWRSYLENFSFRIRHISGKQNLLADFQSRMFQILPFSECDNENDDLIMSFDSTYNDLLELYDQRCFNITSNAYWFQPVCEILDLDSRDPTSLQVFIRDPVNTYTYMFDDVTPLYQVFMSHTGYHNYEYFYKDTCLDGIQSLATLSSSLGPIVLDAVHTCAVMTRSQARATTVSTTPTMPVHLTPSSNPSSSPEGGGRRKEVRFAEPLVQSEVPIATPVESPDEPALTFTDILDSDIHDDQLKKEILELQGLVKKEMRRLHGTRKFHYGANRMYRDACKLYPGHRLPQAFFKDFVAECAICQKARMQKDTFFLERIRSLKENPQPRAAVCIDRVSISPASKRGNTTAIVIADLFTRLAKVYASSEYTSDSVANALKDFLITYGSYDVVQSDPGSDILGGAVDAINARWKLGRKISLVDRHESNGNERLIQELLRHLRALVNDERAMDDWDDVDYLGFVNFCINDSVNSETGLTPYIATFGDRDAAYFELPEVSYDAPKSAKIYIEKLNKSLEKIRQLNREYQLKIHLDRTSKTPALSHNQFREGDLIWYRRPERIDKDGKLFFRNKGPFRVISMRHNDVECSHIVTNQVKVFHVTNVMPVNLDTPYDELYEAAKRDHEQFEVVKILDWRGDITKRSTIEFLTLFEDGDQIWKFYNDPDFKSNSILQEYLNKDENATLMSLRYTLEEWKNVQVTLQQMPIAVFDKCYVDYRSYNLSWREKVGLPELDPGKKYVFEVSFVKHLSRDKRTALMKIHHLDDEFSCSNVWVAQFGNEKIFNKVNMVLIDEQIIKEFPKIKLN